ncbi:MAG: phage portal protein [Lachnospiraceae bacterium]|nr:phage portal protein [Lachnospiraceae bacterium]
MGLFNFKKRAEEPADSVQLSDALLEAFLQDDQVSRKMAMNVPTFAGCINTISNTVSSVPIYLYRRNKDGSSERVSDERVAMLNDDTKDTLTGADLKKAIVRDYYLNKGGYIYINRTRRTVRSLHYVDPDMVTFQYNEDPIFKDCKINCGGKTYQLYDWIKVLRCTQNGWKGKSIIAENATILSVAYNSLKFENALVKKGGNKKGFLQAAHKIADDAIKALKEGFRKLYQNDAENVVILNDGVTFKEASETSVEMQLNENKKSNAVEICKLFNMPPAIINGGATAQDRLAYVQDCIIPLMNTVCTALNRDLLLEKEKKNYYFAADTYELTKADIKTRYDAYTTGIKNGFLQIDDIRKQEHLPSLGLNFVKLGLQDVLYNPENGMIFTPNMGVKANINDVANGEEAPDGAEQGDVIASPATPDQTEPKPEDTGKEKPDEDQDKS